MNAKLTSYQNVIIFYFVYFYDILINILYVYSNTS